MTKKMIMNRIALTMKALGKNKLPVEERDYYIACVYSNVMRTDKPTKQTVIEKTEQFCNKYM